MATTENLFTGDGSTVLFNFTFPYIDETDVYVSLDGTVTTAYSYANATTLQFTTAPTSGVAIRIFRSTSSADTKAAFFAGSAIRSKDLNDNFVQSLYIAQESENLADAAKAQAATAEASAATANTNATAAAASAATATAQATAAAASSSTASAQATQAATDAAAAQASSTAAAASSATAVSEAAQAATNSASAITTAQGAVTTANSAATDAASAITTANAATTAANSAATTANSAATTANSAVTTANSANTSATSATSTANTASTTASSALSVANAASAAVSQAVLFTLVANVAAIPGSPSNNDYIEVGDSTGIQSFSPLSSIPSGFVGANGLTARIRYDSSASSWVFMSYFANDPEDRYFTKANGNTNTTNIATKMPLAGGTFTGDVSFDDNVIVKGDGTNGSGELTLNCENNSHGIKIKGPPHSAGATYTLTLPNNTGTSGQALTTNGSGVLSFADIASSIITQTDFAYKPTSNSLTFNDGLSSTPGSTSSEFSFFTNANTGNFSFMPTNASIKSNMEALQVGDSVTLDWTLPNGTTASQTTTVTTRTAQPIPSGSYGTVVFANAGTYHSSSAASVKLTSSRISNGVEPIANNQVLRYKTATSKWTVDTAEVIAICDGGNFANGSSLVQTSTTFDGGSF